MNAAICNKCGRAYTNADPDDRAYPIHKIVIDMAMEKAYCPRCYGAWDKWEKEVPDYGKKPYRTGFITWISKWFRLWLLRRVLVEVPGGRVFKVTRPNPDKPDPDADDDEDRAVRSPFDYKTPPV
jgi:hypothetical protein